MVGKTYVIVAKRDIGGLAFKDTYSSITYLQNGPYVLNDYKHLRSLFEDDCIANVFQSDLYNLRGLYVSSELCRT